MTDEGASHHDAPPEPFAVPGPGLTTRLREARRATLPTPFARLDPQWNRHGRKPAESGGEGLDRTIHRVQTTVRPWARNWASACRTSSGAAGGTPASWYGSRRSAHLPAPS